MSTAPPEAPVAVDVAKLRAEAQNAFADFKRRAAIRELRKQAGEEQLFLGSQSDAAIAITREHTPPPGGSAHDLDMRRLIDMGFTPDQATDALARCAGNVQAAVDCLLREAPNSG
jgi:hypothetical protein